MTKMFMVIGRSGYRGDARMWPICVCASKREAEDAAVIERRNRSGLLVSIYEVPTGAEYIQTGIETLIEDDTPTGRYRKTKQGYLNWVEYTETQRQRLRSAVIARLAKSEPALKRLLASYVRKTCTPKA